MDSKSPAFNPPMGAPKETDPMISKVPMKDTPWANRTSQQPTFDHGGFAPIVHVPNGK